MKVFFHIGRYFMMMGAVFGKPEKFSIYRKQILVEANNLGVTSIPIVSIISFFIGAVITMQTAAMMAAWVPENTLGYTTRQSTILEFSPTMLSLILAGNVGSKIASEIGTMRVTEQIDAIEIMGVNSRGFLVLPKVVASMMMFPILVIYSMFLSIFGGYFVCLVADLVSPEVYIEGIRYYFDPYTVTYALTKSVVFAFIISSICSYYGYYTRGSALDVGKSATYGVIYSSILILIANYFITQVMLL